MDFNMYAAAKQGEQTNCNLAGRARSQWRTDMCVIRDSRGGAR